MSQSPIYKIFDRYIDLSRLIAADSELNSSMRLDFQLRDEPMYLTAPYDSSLETEIMAAYVSKDASRMAAIQKRCDDKRNTINAAYRNFLVAWETYRTENPST